MTSEEFKKYAEKEFTNAGIPKKMHQSILEISIERHQKLSESIPAQSVLYGIDAWKEHQHLKEEEGK